MNNRTQEPFKDAVGRLMAGRYRSNRIFGNPTLAELVRELGGEWQYENVRKIMSTDRGLPPKLMEDVARIFQIEPSYFLEYRQHIICRLVTKGSPETTDQLYDLAVAVAARMEEKQGEQSSQDQPQRSDDLKDNGPKTRLGEMGGGDQEGNSESN